MARLATAVVELPPWRSKTVKPRIGVTTIATTSTARGGQRPPQPLSEVSLGRTGEVGFRLLCMSVNPKGRNRQLVGLAQEAL
jgi:hypothetical protein